jgi:hypothetical protein
MLAGDAAKRGAGFFGAISLPRGVVPKKQKAATGVAAASVGRSVDQWVPLTLS